MTTAHNDPLAGALWHLSAIGLDRLNDEYTGYGISVGIFDDGVDKTHADLAANYDASKEMKVGTTVLDPSIGDKVHGTSVAGIIAGVADNGVGSHGVAYDAKITGIDIFGNAGGSNMLAAVRHMANFDVSNNSWNWIDRYADGPTTTFGAQFAANLKFAADTGRGGLGTVILNAAGNEWAEHRDANNSEFNQSRHTITVGAVGQDGDVAYYATRGASILVSGPTSGGGAGITTTDQTGTGGYSSGDYTSGFGGTSAATPVVSGVVSLMLDASDNSLGWRDVQSILSMTADHTGPTAMGGTLKGGFAFGWSINGADNWNGGGMHFSNDVGFGLVDGFEAVRWAEVWHEFGAAATSANEVKVTASGSVSKAILDNATASFNVSLSQSVSIEHVDLSLTLTHGNVNQLRVELVSPDGTTSILLSPVDAPAMSKSGWTWTFGSEALRGELSAGTWTVKVTDTAAGSTGTVTGWKLDVYGAPTGADDVYHYTSEFAKMAALGGGRDVLSDTDGGADWINMSGLEKNVVLDLNSGATANGSLMFNIATGTVIENAITGDGADWLRGNASANKLIGMRGDDVLEGRGGADVLDGGTGRDTASYASSAAGVTVSLLLATQVGGDAQGDVFKSIENLEGSGYADKLTGDAGANVLRGLAGNDSLEGGAGADQLDGGAGTDTACYVTSNAAVDLDLTRASQLGGHAEGDVLTGVENLTGSAFNDTLSGNAAANVLKGGDGNDTFLGRGGADVYDGGLGSDTASFEWASSAAIVDLTKALQTGGSAAGLTLISIENVKASSFGDTVTMNADANKFCGGGGKDTAIYTNSTAGVDVDLDRASQLGGWAQGDVLKKVENVTGALNYANKLTGSDVANVLKGGTKNDVIDGGEGNDTLYGGSGFDRFVFKEDFGRDVIMDFTKGQDKIDLTWLGEDVNWGSVTQTVSGGDRILHFAGIDDTIVIDHFSKQAFAGSDFLFA